MQYFRREREIDVGRERESVCVCVCVFRDTILWRWCKFKLIVFDGRTHIHTMSTSFSRQTMVAGIYFRGGGGGNTDQ